jgi:hypothetical protein
MRTVNTHPAWVNQPLRLTEEEKQNPYVVVEEFYTCFHLQDMREILWDWLVAALSCEHSAYNTGYARSNLIFIYEKLESLIEASSEINKRRRKNLKRRQRKRKAIRNDNSV